MDNNNLKHDFESFNKASQVKVDEKLSLHIMNYVKKDLNPSTASVFLKLFSVHGLVGLLTMLFCPQFGYSFTNSDEFYHFLHLTYGESVCMAICGTIFVGSGALASVFILKSIELNKIRDNKFLYYSSVTALFVSLFAFLGAEIYLSLLWYWMLGSIGSGVAILYIEGILRKSFS